MVEELRNLVEQLNIYRDAYYNQNKMLISDKQYDDLFDKLVKLEQETGIILANSPTQTVGYTVQSKLNKVTHTHPMLSLGKTKNLADVVKFIGNENVIAMLKMDGLTCSLTYSNGKLIRAETRGDGTVGEDVTANAYQISNVPLTIPCKDDFVIDGEVIISFPTFNKINDKLVDKYSHPRNLASGSIRQLDTKITAERELEFVAWKVVSGHKATMNESLKLAQDYGFTTVDYSVLNNSNDVQQIVTNLQNCAISRAWPIDGIVFSYDNIAYGEQLGNTSHHPNHSIAYKFYNECYETILRDVVWSTTRTGMLAPVAIFDAVDLDGALTTKATLHNISYMKELELGIGDTILVCRANQVIPRVEDNVTRSNTYEVPNVCPCCRKPTVVRKDANSEMLYCSNDSCISKLLSQFVHFASKSCMDIDGLSESTLRKFIDLGYLKTYKDVFHLKDFESTLCNLEGFGLTSVTNLLNAIEVSRHTTLSRFIVSLGIPQIGVSAAKSLESLYSTIDNFMADKGNSAYCLGPVAQGHLKNWFNSPDYITVGLLDELVIEPELKTEVANDFIQGKTFVVTGAFHTMARKELESFITDRAGKLSGSVSKTTDFLLTNETTETTKYKKAKELNIPVISEDEFFERCKHGL